MVFEYQYTTLLPMLPVLWWLSQKEERAGLRWSLRIAFVVLLAIFLPTLNFLEPKPTTPHYLAFDTLLRVVPVVVAFVCLLLYCVGNWRAEVQKTPGAIELPRGQRSDLIGTGAALTLSFAAVLASVLLSVPQRLTKPLKQWSNTDWEAQIEDVFAFPHPGLDVPRQVALHLYVGEKFFETDKPAALKHYAAAIDLASPYPDLLCAFGDRMLNNGNVDIAISVYRRVLDQTPNHQVAQARLQQLQNRSYPEGR